MKYQICGTCTRCGSPKWIPNKWESTELPPPVTSSCSCFATSTPSFSILPQKTFEKSSSATITTSPIPSDEQAKLAIESLGCAFEQVFKSVDPIEKVFNKLSSIEKRLEKLEKTKPEVPVSQIQKKQVLKD
jgi:hypothetical protein